MKSAAEWEAEIREQARDAVAGGVRVMLAKTQIERTLTGHEKHWVRDGWVPATLKEEYRSSEVRDD